MKVLNMMLAAVAVTMGLAISAPAAAHGYYGHRGYWYGGPAVRFYFGGPLWWGGSYYYGSPYGPTYGPAYGSPYGYAPAPPVVVTPPAPPVYIEREQEPASAAPAAPSATPSTQWWYLCSNPRGAYPYVRECPGGWERVPALPPGSAR
jgi:hypothetical protein